MKLSDKKKESCLLAAGWNRVKTVWYPPVHFPLAKGLTLDEAWALYEAFLKMVIETGVADGDSK